MVRRIAGLLLGLVVIAGLVAVGYAARVATEPDAPPPTTIATETVQIVRTDLVQTETLAGTLRFDDRGEVRSPLPGTVTGLPDEAATLGRGEAVFELDGQPVVLLLGDRPAWRALADGVDDGPDVLQLEENLVALGHGPEDWEPDQEFDARTADAVEAWREESGMADDDQVELGRVVFLAEEPRVGAHLVELGEMLLAGAPVFEITGTDRQVVIDLDPDDVSLVAVGDPATVVLPDGGRVEGAIAEIGRVVRPAGPEPDAPAVFEVIVSLPDAPLDIDRAPVDVEVESSRAEDVLAVPVRALLALSDGGYAVQVGDDLIGVDTGEFAGGLVEVTGALAEGDEVVVPR